jgi:FtsH-binding integral membrane protein
MQYQAATIRRPAVPVMSLEVGARAEFIAKTYAHLLCAIVLFTGIEVMIFKAGWALPMTRAMGGTSWLIVLGAFMVVSWLASRAAHSATTLGVQYAALFGFVLAEAIIFVPLLFVAEQAANGVIQSAAVTTLLGFAGLTAVVFYTRKDFSFMRGILCWAGISALLLIVCSVLFGFQLGTWFSVGMVVFAGGAALYDTSNVLHHYPEDRYVGASLELFASIALMFWYVLRLFLSRRD